MEIASIIISIVAFIVSVIAIITQYQQNKTISAQSIQSRYYEKIFDEYLIEKIPKSREYLKYVDNKLIDAENLIDTLDRMKCDSLYFKYNNEEFYDKIVIAIDDLTKYLSDSSNLTSIDQDKQAEITTSVKNRITEIYKLIYTYNAG